MHRVGKIQHGGVPTGGKTNTGNGVLLVLTHIKVDFDALTVAASKAIISRIKILVFYHEYCSLIGYATHYLFRDKTYSFKKEKV